MSICVTYAIENGVKNIRLRRSLMALFKRKHVELIMQGRKTQTRRIHSHEWKLGRVYGVRDKFNDNLIIFFPHQPFGVSYDLTVVSFI
jgi:hypothetical protein